MINFLVMISLMTLFILLPGISGTILAAGTFIGAVSAEAIFLAAGRQRTLATV